MSKEDLLDVIIELAEFAGDGRWPEFVAAATERTSLTEEQLEEAAELIGERKLTVRVQDA